MEFVYNDGGRAAAGYKGHAGDCVVRAIAIASGKPYQEVYDALNRAAKSQQPLRGSYMPRHLKSSSRNGVYRKIYEPYLLALGFKWTPTMKIGSGCKVHLVADELPSGTLIVAVSKHLTTVIDGVIHDTHDPQRAWITFGPNIVTDENGQQGNEVLSVSRRCVYGYYTAPTNTSNQPT